MTERLILSSINDVYIRIECDGGVAMELSDYFSFFVDGYKYMAKYKSGVWDGKIRLFDISKRTIYAGLKTAVKKFARDRDYEVVDNTVNSTDFVSAATISDINDLSLTMTPRDYQLAALEHCLQNERALVLSPTASGKSFIIYLLVALIDAPALIVVPTMSLVHQMTKDFADYGFDSDANVHMLHGGLDKDSKNKRVVVATWQTIVKMPRSWFSRFKMVIGDEAHTFAAKSLVSIMEKLHDCPYRFGFTGTLSESKTNAMVLTGLFGPVFKVITTAELIKKKQLSDFDIKCIVLKYSEDERVLLKNAAYKDEMQWLVGNKRRNKFIHDLVNNLNGNTLVLYQYVEKHGKPLFEMFKKSGRDCFFIHGGIDVDDRELVRELAELPDSNVVIVASYGTFSAGINIKNLHNVVFASPSKSKIRNLQSIGRVLRRGEHKSSATLYDVADDLSHKPYKNHTLRHFIERVKIYNEECFDYKIINLELK